MRSQTTSFPNQRRAAAKPQDEQIPSVLADVRAMRAVQVLEAFAPGVGTGISCLVTIE